MEVSLLKKEKDSLMIELKGSTTTFTNLISDELWENKDVKEATTIKEHLYLVEPKIFVRANDPKKALLTAAKQIQNNVKELEKDFEIANKK